MGEARGVLGGDGRAFCAVGMATKPIMLTAPCLLLLYDRFFLGGSIGEVWRRRRKVHLGFFATWGILEVTRANSQEEYSLTQSEAVSRF